MQGESYISDPLLSKVTGEYAIIAAIIAIFISNGTVKPVRICTERIIKLSEGDITSPAMHSDSTDEVGCLQTPLKSFRTQITICTI